MLGGGNIAADVGSEQDMRATGTALAFTTTQEQEKNLIAHLFTSSPLPSPPHHSLHLLTTPLTSITSPCTSTVDLVTA
jgi:hypothetical protein